MLTIESNGITLAYDEQGDPQGEAVVLIPGLGMQLVSWPDRFCQQLAAQGLRVIRFDNRDSGLYSKMDELGAPHPVLGLFNSMFQVPLSGYTLYDMADDTVGLLDALDIPQAHIVGVSMGGMIAQIVAARRPQRCLTLTSMMSTSGRPGLPGPTPAASQALLSQPANPQDVDSVIDHFVRLFQTIGSPAYPTPETDLRHQIALSVRRNVSIAGAARQMIAIAASGDRAALLRAIRMPTLVIHGTDDPLVPIAGGRDTASLVPGAVLQEIEGMGHDLPPALETGIADLIAAHCKRVEPTVYSA